MTSHQFKPITEARRLLIMMPSWVGDCVMATPALRAIRRAFEATDRKVFLAGYLRPHLVSLFDDCVEFDECISGRPRGWLGPNREARRLRSFDFDTALLLPNSFRAAWTMRLARIPRRVGYDRQNRGWLLTGRVACPHPGGWSQPIPAIEHYLKLVEPLGVPIDDEDGLDPRLYVSEVQATSAQRLLQSKGIDLNAPIALLNPGASKEHKRWPVARFAALASRLHDEFNMQIVINGAPNEFDLTGALAQQIVDATTLDLAQHRTSLATLAAICARSDLVVTNDTGTRHITAAVGFEQMHCGEKGPGLVTLFDEVQPEWTTLNYPYEIELCDRTTKRVDSIPLDQAMGACRRIMSDRHAMIESTISQDANTAHGKDHETA